MGLGLKYKDSRHIFDERGATVPYLEFPLLRNSGIVNHGFSTRLGGVSEGCFSSMNLSFDRGDRPEASTGKFPKNGKCDWSGMRGYGAFTADPYHKCASCDRKGQRQRDRSGTGLYRCGRSDYRCTGNLSGYILLQTVCRLYFVDPVKKAIGLSHSGCAERWDGLVRKPLKKCSSVSDLNQLIYWRR